MGISATYSYNGLGDRISRTVNSQTTTYTLYLKPSTSASTGSAQRLRAGSGLTQVLADGMYT